MSDSRRSFLLKSFSASSAAWLTANWPAQVAAAEAAQAMGNFTFFTRAEAADVDAMAAQIYPTTDTPGAREAQVIYFIDTALVTFAQDKQDIYRKGLPELSSHTGGRPLGTLTNEQQIAALTAMEKTPFFRTVRDHTIMGMFASPQHGGNYRKVGWTQIGYDDSLNFRAPFGAYDKAEGDLVMKKFKPSEEVDFVVIGSGAAGGVMAKQLAQAGFSVVVMEQGPWGAYGHEQDYNKDELINRFPSEEDKLLSDPSKQRNTFRRNANEKAVPGNHNYGCVVGGGTVTYGASSWRHLPYEFNEASVFGTMKGTGIADWPISYAEIEPYYTQAEWEIGISGPNIKTPLIAPMSKPYPVRPLPLKSSGALMQRAAAKLNLTVTPNVAAIITEPYNGRSGCINCGACSGYGCQVKARSSSAVSLLPVAVATGNCEIRVHSYVREIAVDASGRATGVTYFDKANNNQEVFQKAKCVVLSANGTETPRLLLLSKSNRFPQGLANSSGIVGKYLMTGNGGGASGLFPDPLNEYKGAVTGAAVLSYVPNDVKNRGFYGGGRMTARGQMSPIQYGLAGPHGAPSWGAGYKKALMEQANRRLTMVNFISQLPIESNTVDLDPEVKDAWGLPAMRITTTSHENDFKAMQFFIDRSVDILKAAGATEVWADQVNDSKGGAHARGTCRIGNDPKTSVANKYHRAHDVPNLFIVDGSSLVTGGRNHPTMTISALAYRCADHLVKAAKSGNVTI